VLRRRRRERARGDVVVAVGVGSRRATCRLEYPLAGVIVAVARDPATASLCAREAIPPVPGVVERADRDDVAIVVVGIRATAYRGHRVWVRVAHPSVRARSWQDRVHSKNCSISFCLHETE
jgi:hypothetical protein